MPVDVDVIVIVIGAVPLSTLDHIAERAEASLHRQVHIRDQQRRLGRRGNTVHR